MKQDILKAILAACAALLLLTSCSGTPYEKALRVGLAIRDAGIVTDKVINSLAKSKMAECKKHEADIATYRKCTDSINEILRVWTQVVKKAIDSALMEMWDILGTIKKAQGEKFDWLTAVKSQLCTITKILGKWKSVLPSAVNVIVAAITSTGIICKGATP